MKPLDVYDLGVRLAMSADTQAEHRNAIGRLYYGLHHEACCRYFREHPGNPPLGRGSRHALLIQQYGALNGRAARRVQRLLTQLSRLRNVADYDLSNRIGYQRKARSSAELLGIAVSVAAELLAALDDFSPGEAADGCVCPVVR